MQSSPAMMKTVTFLSGEQAIYLGNTQRELRASTTRKETRERGVGREERERSPFLRLSVNKSILGIPSKSLHRPFAATLADLIFIPPKFAQARNMSVGTVA